MRRIRTTAAAGRCWRRSIMRLGRFDDAVQGAAQCAARLLGRTAEREADLGEALTGAANGVVTAEAKEAFERAVGARRRAMSKARYFLGLAAEQDGRPKDAATIWRALLAEAPADAPWAGVRAANRSARVDPGARSPHAGPERRAMSRPRAKCARAARRDDPRHGGAARRAAEAGWLRRRGLAAAAARLYGAGRQATRRAPRPTMRGARWPAIPTSSGGSTSSIKGLGSKAELIG